MNEATLSSEQMAHLETVIAREIGKLRADLVGVAREANSPWRDRAGAGAYLRIAPRTLDRFKRQGKLVPKYVGDKPIYAVAQLEKLAAKTPSPQEVA